VQQDGADDVDDEAAGGDDQHERALHLLRLAEPQCGLPEDDAGNEEECGAVHQRGQDLHAEVAVRPRRRRRLAGDPEGEVGQGQRGDIVEHVAGIGHERQRVGQPATDELHDHERGCDGQHHDEPLAAQLADVVVVAVVVMVWWL
jgi:hypothetical protein